ncbi:TolC family protein [Alistipes sp. OttesenSCG-928-B03]|nr:TolC family protein [Alistipes sp. OttesenSCG-928-B03]
MKKIILILAIISCALPAAAQDPQTEERTAAYRFTLEDCIEYALGNSFTRKSMELDERSSRLTLEQSRLERLPSISGSAGENYSHTKKVTYTDPETGAEINTAGGNSWGGNLGLSAGVTLFQGGSINKTIEQNRLQAEQAEVRTAQYDNTLVVNILSSYFSILGYQELLDYQESLIEESRQQVETGKIRAQAGSILDSDYLMLEAQLATNESNIIDTRISLENEMLTLKGLLSMDMAADLRIAEPRTTEVSAMAAIPDQLSYMQRAEQTMPDFELLDYSVKLAESSVRIAKSSLWPTLSLSGSLGTRWGNLPDFGNQLSDNFSQSAGLSLSVPIFNRNRTRTNIEKSKIGLRQAELDRMQREIELRQTLTQAYRNVEASLNKYRTLEVRENAYRETFRVYNRQFDAGSITAVDLLQQQNNYISVMYEYVQSKYSFMLRRKILDVYMGLQIAM